MVKAADLTVCDCAFAVTSCLEEKKEKEVDKTGTVRLSDFENGDDKPL